MLVGAQGKLELVRAHLCDRRRGMRVFGRKAWPTQINANGSCRKTHTTQARDRWPFSCFRDQPSHGDVSGHAPWGRPSQGAVPVVVRPSRVSRRRSPDASSGQARPNDETIDRSGSFLWWRYGGAGRAALGRLLPSCLSLSLSPASRRKRHRSAVPADARPPHTIRRAALRERERERAHVPSIVDPSGENPEVVVRT